MTWLTPPSVAWRRALFFLPFAAVFLAVAAARAEDEIEFTGLVGGGDDVRFILTLRPSGQSRWVRVGQEFAGYVVSAYDAKDEALVLTKEGRQARVKLKSSKVKAGAIEPSPATQRAILNQLRQLAAAADQFYLENGKSSTTYDDLVGPTKYVRKLDVVDGEDYRSLVFAQGKPLEVTTSGGFKISYRP